MRYDDVDDDLSGPEPRLPLAVVLTLAAGGLLTLACGGLAVGMALHGPSGASITSVGAECEVAPEVPLRTRDTPGPVRVYIDSSKPMAGFLADHCPTGDTGYADLLKQLGSALQNEFAAQEGATFTAVPTGREKPLTTFLNRANYTGASSPIADTVSSAVEAVADGEVAVAVVVSDMVDTDGSVFGAGLVGTRLRKLRAEYADVHVGLLSIRLPHAGHGRRCPGRWYSEWAHAWQPLHDPITVPLHVLLASHDIDRLRATLWTLRRVAQREGREVVVHLPGDGAAPATVTVDCGVPPHTVWKVDGHAACGGARPVPLDCHTTVARPHPPVSMALPPGWPEGTQVDLALMPADAGDDASIFDCGAYGDRFELTAEVSLPPPERQATTDGGWHWIDDSTIPVDGRAGTLGFVDLVNAIARSPGPLTGRCALEPDDG